MNNIVVNLLVTKKLSAAEVTVLLDLVEKRDQFILEQFKIYENFELETPNNEFNINKSTNPALEEYLIRRVHGEIHRRLELLQDNKISLQTSQSPESYSQSQSTNNTSTNAIQSYPEEDDLDQEDNDNDDDQNEDEEVSLTEKDIENDLSELLESLQIINIWKDSVPNKFILIMFTAVENDILTIFHANTLCDLYASGYDFIKAAWEVYCVQEDEIDLLDTLKRIIRDIKEPKQATTTKSTGKVTNSKKTAADDNNKLSVEDEEKKQIAMQAVIAAKRDLLKHSLEMIVKQGLVTGEAAANLFERALKGDNLIEAAIDAYANDRNVEEFINTLYILASHSTEELETMLNQVRSKSQPTQTVPKTAAQTATQAQQQKLKPSAPPADTEKEESNEVNSDNQLYIRQIIIEITQRGVISVEIAAPLLNLLNNNDERLFGAYEIYTETNDLEDFIDSLLRLAYYEISTNNKNNSKNNSPAGIEKKSSKVSAETEIAEKNQISSHLSPTKEVPFDESVDVADDEDESIDEEPEEEDDNEPLLSSDDQKAVIKILCT